MDGPGLLEMGNVVRVQRFIQGKKVLMQISLDLKQHSFFQSEKNHEACRELGDYSMKCLQDMKVRNQKSYNHVALLLLLHL